MTMNINARPRYGCQMSPGDVGFHKSPAQTANIFRVASERLELLLSAQKHHLGRSMNACPFSVCRFSAPFSRMNPHTPSRSFRRPVAGGKKWHLVVLLFRFSHISCAESLSLSCSQCLCVCVCVCVRTSFVRPVSDQNQVMHLKRQALNLEHNLYK